MRRVGILSQNNVSENIINREGSFLIFAERVYPPLSTTIQKLMILSRNVHTASLHRLKDTNFQRNYYMHPRLKTVF